MALNGNNTNGHIHSPRTDSSQLLTAREKKLMSSSDQNNGNSKDSAWSDEESSEWKGTPSEILSLKQSINFECSNSISIPINFSEAWSYFQSCDMSEFSNRNDGNPRGTSFRRKFQGLMGHPALNSALVPEKDLVFAVAACPMNNDCSIHRRVLQSIYVLMTKNPSCPRYGSHWEEVGFQGQDPASDLRGAGMFGALQMLYMISAQETKDAMSQDVYELSRHPVHQFPLAVLSLNVTRMTLDALRDGVLNRVCNKKSDCIGMVNRFYVAIMYRIYRKWKDKGMTIHDSCYLLKAVEKWCRAHPQRAFSRLEDYLAQNENANGTGQLKKKRSKKKSERVMSDDSAHRLSWLDLTKPSLEVFI